MKKFTAGLIIGILLVTTVFAGAIELFNGFETIKVIIDGEKLQSKTPALLVNGIPYLPANEICNATSTYLNYNPNTRTLDLRNSILVYPTKIKVDDKAPREEYIIFDLDENSKPIEIYVGLSVLRESVSGYKFEEDNSLTINTFLQSKVQNPTIINAQDGKGVFAKINGKSSTEKVFYLYADDKEHTYLGKITNDEYDSDSIFNKYGEYGNEYRTNSIWNTYGTFGSQYSSYSPFNEYTSTPPIIKNEKGETIGRLTVNEYISGAISPYEIDSLLK